MTRLLLLTTDNPRLMTDFMDFKFRVWHQPEKKLYYAGYQKLSHVLLCDDDRGANQGRGIPVKDARYDDCEFLQGTGVFDRHEREIYEGDRVRIFLKDRTLEGTVENVPDMYKSRGLHPMQELLDRLAIPADAEMTFEVLGNRYE